MNIAGENGGIIACEFQPGDAIDGYEILNLIGHGSMGNVYRVRHTMMQEEYALKTLRPEKLTDVSWKRFQIEAQSVAKLSHPNLVTIYNFGLHQKKVPYYVMGLVEGKSLLELVSERGPLPVEEVLPIFAEVCRGLNYAHSKNIIHRDIKPPNIIVLDKPQAGGRVKLVDFGIAKITGDQAGTKQNLTAIGEVCGSPLYMSPEQCEGGTVDARSDVYSTGCTLYEALTGAPPFRGRNVVDTMLKHQSEKPLTLSMATGGRPFHPMLERVVSIMLAKSPNDRYQTMAEAAQDLQAIIHNVSPPEFQKTSTGSPTRSSATNSSVSNSSVSNSSVSNSSVSNSSVSNNSVANNPATSNPATNSSATNSSVSNNALRGRPSQSMPPDMGANNLDFNVESGDTDFAPPELPDGINDATVTIRMKQASKNAAALSGAGTSGVRRPSESQVRRANPAPQMRAEEVEEGFSDGVPSHFVRLMVGSFIVICLLLAALGYWWIQSSTPTAPHALNPESAPAKIKCSSSRADKTETPGLTARILPS